jgi:hypothetical protein
MRFKLGKDDRPLPIDTASVLESDEPEIRINESIDRSSGRKIFSIVFPDGRPQQEFYASSSPINPRAYDLYRGDALLREAVSQDEVNKFLRVEAERYARANSPGKRVIFRNESW